MVTFFFVIYITAVIRLMKKTRLQVLHNELFWMVCSWVLIVGVHFASGVRWKYDVSIWTVLYVALCLGVFVEFHRLAQRTKPMLRKPKINSNNISIIKRIGWGGLAVYVFDYIRLNGFGTTKSTYAISFLGAAASLFIPILLVAGLHVLGEGYVRRKKVEPEAVILLIGYTLPCILNSGRESILYVTIGVVSILAYGISVGGFPKINSRQLGRKEKISVGIALGFFVGIVIAMLVITAKRFTSDEINVFLANNEVPKSLQIEGKLYGPFAFLFYNVVSYFGHQMAFLEHVIMDYNGPYMFGMYEFNIISRRLPETWGLDYTRVYEAIDPFFRGSWQTMIGSLIFDFGRVLPPVILGLLGFAVGRVRRQFSVHQDAPRAVLIALICITMFMSIQIGPIYNVLNYGAIIWWLVMFTDWERILEKIRK